MKRQFLWPLIVIGSVVLISLALTDDGRLQGQDGAPSDSVVDANSYVFQLKLGNTIVGVYDECSGLGSSNDIVENKVVTDSGTTVVQKTPDALRWYNITLKRKGLSDGNVWSWRKAMEEDNRDDAFRDGAIEMFASGSSQPVARWTFSRGWAASLSIEGSGEVLTIAHEGLERVAVTDEPPPFRR